MKCKQDGEPKLFFLSLPTDGLWKRVFFFAYSIGDRLCSMGKRTFRRFEHSWHSGLQRLDGSKGFLLKLEILGEFCQANDKIGKSTLRDDDSEASVVYLSNVIVAEIHNGLCSSY